MKTLTMGFLAFLAGYGAASFTAAHRELRELREGMSDSEVERRTRPEPFNGLNLVPPDEDFRRWQNDYNVLDMMTRDN